jgi:hypothetical protein
VTKGGTNDFHGALFYGGRNDYFDANDFFNNRCGRQAPGATPPFLRWGDRRPDCQGQVLLLLQLRGAAGEARRAGDAHGAAGDARSGDRPVPQRGTGAIEQLTAANIAAIFPNAGTNPAAIAALADAARKYPANDFNAGDSAPGRLLNTAGYRFNAPITEDRNSHVARLDFNLATNHQIFARANYIQDNLGNVQNFPDTPQPSTWSHPNGYTVGHTWTVSNSVVNNFRYGVTRDSFSTQGDSSANAVSFRFIFSPFLFSRTLNRTTPVQNITNDIDVDQGFAHTSSSEPTSASFATSASRSPTRSTAPSPTRRSIRVAEPRSTRRSSPPASTSRARTSRTSRTR